LLETLSEKRNVEKIDHIAKNFLKILTIARYSQQPQKFTGILIDKKLFNVYKTKAVQSKINLFSN